MMENAQGSKICDIADSAASNLLNNKGKGPLSQPLQQKNRSFRTHLP